MHISEKESEAIELIYVEAESFPEGIRAAWDKLEADLKEKTGRKFFGISKCVDQKMLYYAAMNKFPGDENLFPEFNTYKLAGGKWACTKIRDWMQHIPEIGPTFRELEKGRAIDPDRPYVESYRSYDELQLWVPVL